MTYCSNCGEEVDSEANFCQACGTKLDRSPGEQAPGGTADSGDEGDADDGRGSTVDGGVDWSHVVAAMALALVPAFGAYMGVSIAANDVVGVAFFLALPVFGYLLYQRPTVKAMVGGVSFWLAIEAFLAPFVFLVYTFVFASQEATTGAEQAGAAIGGIVLVAVAFLVGFPVGIVLYLVSRRLDTDGDEGAGAADDGAPASG